MIIVGVKHRRTFNLPAAGLDETKAQSILFALRRAATSPEVRASFYRRPRRRRRCTPSPPESELTRR
jgi:hypothetical protein